MISYGMSLPLYDLLHLVWESLGSSCCFKWHYFILIYGLVVFLCIYVPHLFPPIYLSFFLNLFFNWRETVLQCVVGFCHITSESAIIYIYPLPPLPSPQPSRSSQSIRLSSLCYIATFHQLSISRMVVYICWCYFSPFVSLSPSPTGHKSVLYVFISIPYLQMGSLILFF